MVKQYTKDNIVGVVFEISNSRYKIASINSKGKINLINVDTKEKYNDCYTLKSANIHFERSWIIISEPNRIYELW